MKALIVTVTVLAVLATDKGCDLQPPGDKTPAGPPVPGVEAMIEVTSNPSNIYATVRINAYDHSGRPSVSILTSELYPTEHARRTPHREGIVHPASATVTYSVDAIISGEPGDLLGCKIFVDDVVPTGPDALEATHVAEILDGMTSAQVSCTYTRYLIEGAS